MAYEDIIPDAAPSSKFHKFDNGDKKLLAGEFLYEGEGNYGTEYTVLTKEGTKTFKPPAMLKNLILKAKDAGKLNPGVRIAALVTGMKDMGKNKNPMFIFKLKIDPDTKLSVEGRKLLAEHESGDTVSEPF